MTITILYDDLSSEFFGMTASKQQVSAFLRDFKEKMKIWNILFRDDRGKNAQTLLDLELRPIERLKIIEALDVMTIVMGLWRIP